MSEEGRQRAGVSPTKLLDVAIILIPFLGGLTLVIVAIAYNAFYDFFGVKPAEVGFDQVSAVNRAYATILGYLAVFVILLTLGTAAWRSLRLKRTDTLGELHIGLPVAAAYCVWLFAFLSQRAAPRFELRIQDILPVNLGYEVTLALSEWTVSVPVFLTIVAVSVILWAKKRYRGTPALTMTTLNLLFALIVLMASAYRTGYYSAWALVEGGPTYNTFHDGGGPAVDWFSVPTPCVDVVWIGTEPKPASLPSQDVVYLGDAEGTVLLLEAREPYITRLPLNQLMLQEKPAPFCPGMTGTSASEVPGDAAP